MPKNVKTDKKKKKKSTIINSGKLKKLNNQIKALNDDIKKSEDKYVRLMAEFENFKKRNNKALIDSHQKSLEKIVNSFFSSISPFLHTLTNHFCLTSLFIIIPINYIISNNSSYKDSYDTYSQHSKSISYTHANISNSVLATDCLNLLLVPLVNLLCSPPPSSKYIKASPTCECSFLFGASLYLSPPDICTRLK